MCSVLRRMGTAYHEAGHAVASYAAWPQHPVKSATIVPAGRTLGRVRFCDRIGEWRKEFEDGHMAEAVLAEVETIGYLAGHEAESRFCDGIAVPPDFWRQLDSAGAADSVCETCDPDADPRQHVIAYCGRTSELLSRPNVWRAIVHTAAALLRAGTLPGGEIEAIVAGEGVRAERNHEPLFWKPPDDPEDDDEASSWERW